TFKKSSCAPLEFFLHFSGIAACTKHFIGVSYRHVIRVLQRFYNEKLIEKSNGVIVIKDFSRMKEVAKDNIYEQ
ncbi:helix-turn-helix domain-containing protein, partial [Bacillus cereus]|uniref:helix-turn-helix domain-containing protein n=1 Tax=Bacillus cereus TaxID=1396 RepID=UPI00211253C5|nr:helix-turn-helix domain-containing protein [Bacillus cereus]